MFADGDTGTSEPKLNDTSARVNSSTGSDDLVLTINTERKKNKKRKRSKRDQSKGEEKKRSIRFDLSCNMTRGKSQYI